MADPTRDPGGEPPRHIHIDGEEKKKFNWLPWLLLALGLIALLFALSRCNRRDAVVTTNTTTVTNTTAAGPSNGVVAATNTAGVSGLGAYLAGNEAAPRTFTFEKLHFDTAKADIRDADKPEVNSIAEVLKKYPNTNIRIAGFADARGTPEGNKNLGQRRADAVKAALVAEGIAANRIETGSGGESNPVATNATAQGQFENRRTELVVTRR